MKILYVMDSLGTGGAERSTADLWYYLRGKGVELKVVALEHRRQGIEKEVVAAGFDVHFLRTSAFLAQALEIGRVIAAFQPDVVHAILFRASIRTRVARFFRKFCMVESLVNCTYDPVRLKDPGLNRWAFYFYKFIDRKTARVVDSFVAVTHAVKDHYAGTLGIPPGNIEVIYRGRSENPFLGDRDNMRRQCREELGLPADALLVAHVGRQEFQKGHTVLLKAIAHIERETDKEVAFVFLGREGNASAGIRQLLWETPFKNVHWLGHRSDVPTWLAGADLFVFPSLYEGLGGALIEAQAAGLPVVCSDIPVLREVVEAGSNALLCTAGDDRAFSDQIVKLISDPNLRHKMGSSSLGRFRRHFKVDQVNAAMAEFYRKRVL